MGKRLKVPDDSYLERKPFAFQIGAVCAKDKRARYYFFSSPFGCVEITNQGKQTGQSGKIQNESKPVAGEIQVQLVRETKTQH